MNLFSFGQAIKELRQKRGLSQKELASGICTQALISKLEKGNDIPSALILNQISTKLGVEMNYFFDMLESHKVEYLTQSKKYIRQLIRMRDYHNLYSTVLSEIKHPYYQENMVDLQFLMWHEAICIHYVEKNSVQALNKLNEALIMTKNKKYYTEQEVEIFISIAIIQREIELFEEAENSFREALVKLKEVPQLTNSTIELRILFGFAQLLTDIGRYQESLDYCEVGISSCKELETHYLLGEFLYQRAECLARMGIRGKAEEAFEQSIQIFELQNNRLLVQSVRENQSELLGIQNKRETSK